jgi:hypothetical protein
VFWQSLQRKLFRSPRAAMGEKRKSAPDEGLVNIHNFHFRSMMLARTLHAQVPLGLHRNNNQRSHTLELFRQGQRNRARTQMPPQKNVLPCSKSLVQRIFKIVSLGSCHKGERRWQPIYVRPCDSRTRFFMINRRREGEELCEEFKVLGSTGNVRWDQNTQFGNFSLCYCWQVYTVLIGRLPSCDCAYIVYSLYFCLATSANSLPRPRRGSR